MRIKQASLITVFFFAMGCGHRKKHCLRFLDSLNVEFGYELPGETGRFCRRMDELQQ